MSRCFKRLSGLAVALVLLGALGFFPDSSLYSREARDFTGFYEVADVRDLGLDMALRLSLRVFNLSGGTIQGATITLHDSVLIGTTYATFTGTAIPDNGSVNLSANVTVPHSEYRLWKAGGTPRLEIEFHDASGALVRRLIELSPKPTEEE